MYFDKITYRYSQIYFYLFTIQLLMIARSDA